MGSFLRVEERNFQQTRERLQMKSNEGTLYVITVIKTRGWQGTKKGYNVIEIETEKKHLHMCYLTSRVSDLKVQL